MKNYILVNELIKMMVVEKIALMMRAILRCLLFLASVLWRRENFIRQPASALLSTASGTTFFNLFNERLWLLLPSKLLPKR